MKQFCCCLTYASVSASGSVCGLSERLMEWKHVKISDLDNLKGWCCMHLVGSCFRPKQLAVSASLSNMQVLQVLVSELDLFMLTQKLDIFWRRVGLLQYMYVTSIISADLDIACCIYIHFLLTELVSISLFGFCALTLIMYYIFKIFFQYSQELKVHAHCKGLHNFYMMCN